MGYIALKPMKPDIRPGDSVPQAADWKNVHNHIRLGRLALVAKEQEEEFREALKGGGRLPQSLAPYNNPAHLYLACKRFRSGGPEPVRPKAATQPETAPPVEDDNSREELLAEAASLGVAVDGRWGKDRILQEMAEQRKAPEPQAGDEQ